MENQFDNELPFVAYRKPNESKLQAFLQNDASLHKIMDYSETGFVFAPFDNKDSTILIPISNSKAIQSTYMMSRESETSHHFKNPDPEQMQFHLTVVQKGIDGITSGNLQKVVLSRKECIKIEEPNPITIFRKLLNTYDSAFVYFWFHPKVGLWLGATPETFLKIEGNHLTTMSLAGTQKFEGKTKVIWRKKEQEEQQFVTDFIIESLHSLVKDLKVYETETFKAGSLLHLKAIITANLKPETLNLKQIIESLHPTPAVCGLPKERAKEFILNHEHYNREFYTGFLGELNLKERKNRNSNRHNVENDAYASVKTTTNLFVNLRCMQLKKNQAFIYVGGGITKDSIPEKEWEETVAKSQVIKSVL